MDLYSKTRFNKAPVITKRRTRFDLSHPILTTFNTGDLVPIFAEPVFPGETHSLRTASLVRLETSLHQTMDQAYFETAFFFVPAKTVWTNFDKFLGANDDPWTQSNVYHVPQLKLTNTNGAVTISPDSILHHLAVPAGSYGSGASNKFISIDALPLRSIYQCWNDWYRDENYDSIIYFSKNDNDITMDAAAVLLNGAYFTPHNKMLKVNRFKDLFSTALPAPQKGQEVTFGISGLAPLVAQNDIYDTGKQIKFGYFNGTTAHDANGVLSNNNIPTTTVPAGLYATGGSGDISASDEKVTSLNLKADLSQASAVTINQLRLAITAQAIAERDARGGTRMKEKIYAEWGVHVNDLEIDRSEFLGGKRIPVSMMEVLQTSETGTTVLGTDAGHSKTLDSSESFVKSFTQYGWIVGFCYVRTSRNYSQGIDRRFRNNDIYSLYDPLLDNIGELPVLKSELYSLDTATDAKVAAAEAVFGYQEAWYHLKERTGRFSGYFQPGISGTLDTWHYGDKYTALPQASASWLKEGPENVDRTIAVSSNVSFQWSANLYFEYYATRTMGKYSIPNTFGF